MVKQGYKQTEIGVIPEDWEVKTIREVSTLFGRIGFRGYTVKDIVKEGDGAISISPSNIKDGKITFYNNTYISWFKYEESPEIKIYNGDILLVKTGSTVGKTALVKNLKQEATLNPQVVVFKKLKINNEFLSYVISDSKIQNQIITNVVGGAIPTLSQELVYSFQIPLPPLAEQEAIASALSDADAWIESLEQLIAKKRLIKQGAMQTLLTPKEDWEVKKLGEVVEIKRGQIITSSVRVDGDVPVIAGGKTPAYFHNVSNRKGKTITISASGASAGYVGFHNYPIFASDCSTISESDKYIIEYIYYFLIRNQEVIYSYQTGGAQPHIHAKDVEPMLIGVPSLSEQERIARILSDMDAELEALEQQLAKARQIKQGMMQELLTGRIRLV